MTNAKPKTNILRSLKANFNQYAVYLFLVLILLLAQLYSPTYLQLTHMMGVLRLASFMGMAAIGQTIAILSGGIDLSIPYTISFAYILAAQYMDSSDANIPVAILVCLILGALGIANMWAAIFADVGVMIIAVLNAIRALNVKKL